MKTIRGWILIGGGLAIVAAGVWLGKKLERRASSRKVAAAEVEVYEVVLRDLVTEVQPSTEQEKSSTIESRIQRLAFHDSLDSALCLADPDGMCVDRARQELWKAGGGKVRQQTIENFIERAQTSGSLPTTFHKGVIRTSQIMPLSQRFARVNGVVSFSHAGFDSSLDEAIVSASYTCGGLCGEGNLYVLRKKSGHWEIVDKWTRWVS